MRYITADYIFSITSPAIKNGTVVIDDNGIVIDITKSEIRNPESEIFQGIICPGFINAHCHLELSYMKGMIPETTGLAGFIRELLQVRKQASEQNIKEAIEKAEQEMIVNGIIAVGDISNDKSTFSQKAKRNLFYHTFIEIFDLNPLKANEAFQTGKILQSSPGLYPSSLIPHAPYSVSGQLMKMISDEAIKNNSILCIHNQETESENELFKTKSGELYDFFKIMGVELTWLPLTGKNSLQTFLPLLPKGNKILLVHNTFANKEDLKFAQQYSKNIYWCFCPNANLFIENQLPDYKLFLNESAKCCIGTDSYASNRKLSILDEMKTISKHAPEISLQTLLEWSTINGAEFLGIENQFGSIEKNKKPGINLIENVDLENLWLSKESKVKKLA